MTTHESRIPGRVGKRHLLYLGVLLALAGNLGAVAAAEDAADDSKKDTTTLESIVVSAPDYVPRDTNGAAKSTIPLIETPQSVTVIPRDQIDLLDWQNLSQVVRYTAGVIGENYGADPRYDWLTLRGFYPPEYIDGLQAPIGSVSNVGVDLYGFQSVEVLKGPSSTLYGLAPPGGIVNLTSRRPEAQFSGEAQLQYGSYANGQVAADVTGPLDADGRFLGRLTALYFDKGTQTNGVDTNRYYIAPAFTWVVSPETNLTLLSYFQHDDVYGDGGGFLPIFGVAKPNPLGKVPTNTNLGDTDYNHFKRDEYGVGYDFSHKFNDDWRFEQNLKYFSSDVKILQVYGAGLVDANFDGVPDDYHTVNRYNFPFNENTKSFNVDSRVEGKIDSGDVKQHVLFGLDYRRYTENSEFGFASAPPIDLFNPVYGVPIVTPTSLFPYVQEVQKQTGVYGEDQIKLNRWVLTLGGRYDNVDQTNSGASESNSKFTYRAGLNYLFESGFAPYVSYSTSFQPTPGADFGGHAFKPTSGDQVEAGIKFQPTFLPAGMNALLTVAAYDLNQKNVLTPDPNTAHAFFNVQTGAVEVKGLELEGVARFNERWSFNAAYTYTDSQVTKSNGADLGKQLVQVPKQLLSALVDYTEQDGRFAGLGASLGGRYVGSSYGDPANAYKAPSVVLWDATIHYNLDKWVMQLNLSNLFDKEYLSRCSSDAQCFYGLRRVINATVTRKF
ncbi:MAG TPA: TonB-dependent siderophore receptor [Rudaea sp.]|jgi:iron complex outermembrane receptor protein|uniref:TonB-dependent siderophore receptor n=1 Tax=Rudaea sp. TaxID=2136325 RepID=UPI002F94BC43